MNKSYFVIIGVGRSGTSLLHSLLASHSAIRGVPETSILRRHILRRRLFNESEWVFIRNLQNDNKLKRLNLGKFEWNRERKYSSKTSRFRMYLRILFFGIGREEKWVCDKDPNLINVLHRVPRAYNPSLVIELVRDPRDVHTSTW